MTVINYSKDQLRCTDTVCEKILKRNLSSR